MEGGYVLVIGGACVDITGRCTQPPKYNSPNPGRVSLSLGGTGRNAARNLSLLGVPVRLMTVLGGDYWAARIREDCSEAGVDFSLSVTDADEKTPSRMIILNDTGEPELRLVDDELFSRLTPEYLAARSAEIGSARAVVFDANIPRESAAWLAANCGAPLIADPVSSAKAHRLTEALARLTAIKPNIEEAQVLSGIAIETDFRLRRAAESLTDAGVKNVFVTLGADGIYVRGGEREYMAACAKARVVDHTGHGDAALAAIAWAFLRGMDIGSAADAAQAAAALTLEYRGAVNPDLSQETLLERMGRKIEN